MQEEKGRESSERLFFFLIIDIKAVVLYKYYLCFFEFLPKTKKSNQGQRKSSEERSKLFLSRFLFLIFLDPRTLPKDVNDIDNVLNKEIEQPCLNVD